MARAAIASSIGALGLGRVMVSFPAETEVALGRIIGLVLVVAGVSGLIEAPRHRTRPDFGWNLASSGSLVAVGGLIVAFPSELLSVLTFALALVWIVVEILAISVLLDPDRDADTPRTPTSELISQWFAERPKTVEDRQPCDPVARG